MKRWILGTAGIFGAGWFLRSWLCRLLGCPEERITVTSPSSGSTVTNPFVVSGMGSATQHNLLAVEIRDESNTVIGSGTASVAAALGQRGPYSVTVAFSGGSSGAPG